MNQFIQQQSARITAITQDIETRVRKISIINLLLDTFQAFGRDNGSMIAAALAYYALLSIFPLLLFLIAIANTFIPPDRVTRAVLGFIASNVPTNAKTIETVLQEVIRLRGTVTIFAAAGFLWSAMGVFNMIQLGINRAFRVQHARPRWRQTLVSAAMVAGVSLLFIASFALTTWLRVAVHYRIMARGNPILDFGIDLLAFFISILVFAILYRFIPYDEGIRWRDVWLGAILAAGLWEIAKIVFAWYITDYATLNLVYGPLGAVIALMLWGYLTAVILLLGAELTAVKSGAHQRDRTGKEWWAVVSR